MLKTNNTAPSTIGRAVHQQEKSLEQTEPRNYSRRDAIRALGKYSVFAGTTAVVVFSSEDAVAKFDASFVGCIEDLGNYPFGGSQDEIAAHWEGKHKCFEEWWERTHR